MCQEHGINSRGNLEDFAKNGKDKKEVFFCQADDDHFIPRALMVDLEPRVISDYAQNSKNTHFRMNPENCFIESQGSGAGNNFAIGYSKAEKNYKGLMEMIDREADNCDNLEGFLILHSISGGSGSGVGSFILEKLRDRYPKKLIQTYSVFPDLDDSGDVVVQSYNSVLCLKRLVEYADSVIVLDNIALNQIATERLHLKNPSIAQTNSLVSQVLASTTNTIRFPGYMNNNLVGIVSSLVPTPRCHFLVTGYTPLTLEGEESQNIQKTSVTDVMGRLLHQKNLMASCPITKQGSYMSLLNMIQGEVDSNEIYKSIHRIREKKIVNFVPWAPSSIQVALSRKSPYIKSSHKVSGLLMANHTSIHTLFDSILVDFDKIYKRKAFLNTYQQSSLFANNLDEFEESKNVVLELSEEYKACEKKDYLEWAKKKEKK